MVSIYLYPRLVKGDAKAAAESGFKLSLGSQSNGLGQIEGKDRKMSEVPAHTAPVIVGIPRRLGRAGVLITEHDAIMDVVADRFHQWPSFCNLPEQRPRDT